ncbi:PIN domain-containing protein [Amycolatopsis sp. FDAARGOS 1241]|nr:PIN domain-containing protein [Amycolatopsis sp. FDAARGOS 1241]
MTVARVFVDANVLYSRTLRDWLCLLRKYGPEVMDGEIFIVYWTEHVLSEATYHLLKKHPAWDGAKLTQIRDRIVATFEGGRVEDFTVDGSFPGTDRNDQHVHAAAVACDADILLSDDGGFSVDEEAADDLPYEVFLPDDFFLLIEENMPEVVRRVTLEQTLYWRGRKTGRADLARPLIDAGCPEFAKRVRFHQSQLSLPAESEAKSEGKAS